MRNRGLRRRIAMLVASASLVGGLSVVAAPAAFAAIPVPPATGCNWGDITWTFGANTKPWVIIDALWTTQAPGGTLSVGQTMTVQHTVTTSISGTVATSAEAGVFFAKASASASLTLAGSGSTTNSYSETTTVSVTNSTSTQKDYVIWRAVRKVTMTAYRYQCSRTEKWVYVTSGPLTSFASQTHSSIRCDISYTAGSVQASAKTYC
jgi:hypothetical protein